MIRASMSRKRRAILAVAILCCTCVSSGAEAAQLGQSPWVDQTNSKVRLVSGTLSEDGKPALYAGVQLRMDPGWKTYWRNPGDSGVPPSFDWSRSKNLKHAEVLYPIPHRFADANGTAIGYDDEVVFPVRITPKEADRPVQLSLTLDYGLCKELCIPNSVELNAKLPANLGKGDAALIRQAKARIPQPAGDEALPRIDTITAKLDGPTPRLEFEAVFPDDATNTDLFVTSAEILVPVPKAVGLLKDGKQRFAVTLASPDEAAAVKGKPLTFTLVSDQGAREMTKIVP